MTAHAENAAAEARIVQRVESLRASPVMRRYRIPIEVAVALAVWEELLRDPQAERKGQ